MDKEIDIKRIKGKRNNGFCFLILGLIIFVWSLFGMTQNWYYGLGALAGIFTIMFGIILMVIGFALVGYNSVKLSDS